MHPIQEKLLMLAKRENLAQLSLREMGAAIDLPAESPQKIKHHLSQLEKKGFLSIDRSKGSMELQQTKPGWARGLLETTSSVFAIPIVGSANCGPASIFAEENVEGFLRVSSKLVGRSSPKELYALRADGSSMNRAEVDGRRIEDRDYVIVDSRIRSPRSNDVVVAIIDNKATIKRFIDDRANGQVVLRADSFYDYEPIFLHEDDEFSISGKVVAVIKNPIQ
jgi:SOS-response transcriptional repressor LexA